MAQFNKNGGNPENGWPLLAKVMEQNPELEAFSRFRELNIKNLLYYQVELASIKEDLEEQEKWDRSQCSPRSNEDYSMYADNMIQDDSAQWKLVLKLRRCIREYSKPFYAYL